MSQWSPERPPTFVDSVIEKKGIVIYARRKGWKLELTSADKGQTFCLKITDDRGQVQTMEFEDFDLTEITGYSQQEAMAMIDPGPKP